MKDKNFEALLYGITAKVVAKLMVLNGWTENIAMERFAESKLYSYLEREETKVWHYSTLMLAELFNEERSGGMLFPEV